MHNTTHEIVEAIQRRIDRTDLGGLTLKILEEEIRQEGDFWYVPVQSTPEPRRLADYFETLAEIEADLMEENINILFIPADA